MPGEPGQLQCGMTSICKSMPEGNEGRPLEGLEVHSVYAISTTWMPLPEEKSNFMDVKHVVPRQCTR